MAERLDDRMPRHLESASQIIPDRDSEFGAGFGETQKCIPAITAAFTHRSRADLPPRDATTDVVLLPVGVKRYFRPLQHHQQLGLVGVQPRQQPVQRGEAGVAEEDAAIRRWLALAGAGIPKDRPPGEA